MKVLVEGVAAKLPEERTPISLGLVTGGTSQGNSIQTPKSPKTLAMCTPGLLLVMLRNHQDLMNLTNVTYLILDEVQSLVRPT